MTSEADLAADPPPSGPGRRVYLWAALGLVVLSLAAIWIAARADPSDTIAAVDVKKLPVGRPAPELHAQGWLNSAALSPADLSGKVVVYDFWTYSCINCVRTLPYLRAWYDRYRNDGLVVVGVHSPEFDFEKDHGNVEQAVSRLKVTWPVALDDDIAIWDAFANRYWPAKWVTDRQGRIRYFHPGEGNYAETENVIRALLGVSASSPRAHDPKEPQTAPDEVARNITQETYLGTERGSTAEDGQHAYAPGELRLHQPGLAGTWQGEPERIRSVSPEASLSLRYLAREVNLVMATGLPGGAPIDVTVELDGKPIPEGSRTADTKVDDHGATYVRVQASDLYRLAFGPRVEEHTLRLTPRTPGLEAFAFTFGS
ncbi:MAG TPA: redoxin domain-containing protein [Acidimicrobiia bacterium]|nr:redoxin domain-containing protein [Acidimicrobiia bacterium]